MQFQDASAQGGILADWQIRRRALAGMIEPFCDDASGRQPGHLSHGLSPYGYDARLASSFLAVKQGADSKGIIDPKNCSPDIFEKATASDSILIPPHGFVLGHTMEYFRIPRDILAICMGKSTYARCGIVVNVTPLEPEWEGEVTLEISNTTPLPVKVYVGEGICQFIFLKCFSTCEHSYPERGGRYQHQRGVVGPRGAGGTTAASSPVAAGKSSLDRGVENEYLSPSTSCESDQMWVPVETMSTIAAKLANPNAVHANMLRGSIAKPSLEQILHIYGVDAVAGAVAKWRASAARLETLNLKGNA